MVVDDREPERWELCLNVVDCLNDWLNIEHGGNPLMTEAIEEGNRRHEELLDTVASQSASVREDMAMAAMLSSMTAFMQMLLANKADARNYGLVTSILNTYLEAK